MKTSVNDSFFFEDCKDNYAILQQVSSNLHSLNILAYDISKFLVFRDPFWGYYSDRKDENLSEAAENLSKQLPYESLPVAIFEDLAKQFPFKSELSKEEYIDCLPHVDENGKINNYFYELFRFKTKL